MKHRPNEVKAVTALLSEEHDSVDELAMKVLDLLHDIKWNRHPWVAIQRARPDGPWFTAWGPYSTRGEAERDVGKRIVGASPLETAYFARVYNKDTLDGPLPEIWEPE